jgi:hypothetical protein
MSMISGVGHQWWRNITLEPIWGDNHKARDPHTHGGEQILNIAMLASGAIETAMLLRGKRAISVLGAMQVISAGISEFGAKFAANSTNRLNGTPDGPAKVARHAVAVARAPAAWQPEHVPSTLTPQLTMGQLFPQDWTSSFEPTTAQPSAWYQDQAPAALVSPTTAVPLAAGYAPDATTAVAQGPGLQQWGQPASYQSY